MIQMSLVVARELKRLAKEAWLGLLGRTLDSVNWTEGMRLRLVLELDVLMDEVRVHGYEFRFRKPNGRIVK